MLFLTRKIGQTFILDDETYITITGIRGNQARIGIDAPNHVEIMREELKEQERQSNILVRPNVIYRPNRKSTTNFN